MLFYSSTAHSQHERREVAERVRPVPLRSAPPCSDRLQKRRAAARTNLPAATTKRPRSSHFPPLRRPRTNKPVNEPTEARRTYSTPENLLRRQGGRSIRRADMADLRCREAQLARLKEPPSIAGPLPLADCTQKAMGLKIPQSSNIIAKRILQNVRQTHRRAAGRSRRISG